MSDEEKKDQNNVKDTLKGVLAIVENKKNAAKEAGKSHKPWGWIAGLVLAVLVFVSLAIVAWQAWKKGREIAKLKHQIDVEKEKKYQAEIDAEIETVKIEKKKLETKAARLNDRIHAKKIKVRTLEIGRREAHSKIDLITTWEDVDKLFEDSGDQ